MKPASDDELYAAGTVIHGRYEIMGMTQRNPVTVVYAAQDSVTRKTVSMKFVVSKHMPDSSYVGRLQQEARVLSRARHPHIIKMIDFGTSESGQAFLVTDMHEGKQLSAIVQEERGIAYERALPIIAQLCDALQSLHDSGIVHRNLDPAHMLVTKDEDGYDVVEIVDFEAAIFLSDSAQLAAQLAPDNPKNDLRPFISPEQLCMRRVDIRADIFSMGCLIYFLLLGVAPFTAGELRYAINNREFLRLKKFADLRQDVTPPAGIEEVARKAVELDPADRWQSADQLFDALLFTAGSVSLAQLDSIQRYAKNIFDRNQGSLE